MGNSSIQVAHTLLWSSVHIWEWRFDLQLWPCFIRNVTRFTTRDSVVIIPIPKRPTPPTRYRCFLSEFPHRNGWFLASKPLNSSGESPIVSINQPPASPIVSHERWSTHPWLSSWNSYDTRCMECANGISGNIRCWNGTYAREAIFVAEPQLIRKWPEELVNPSPMINSYDKLHTFLSLPFGLFFLKACNKWLYSVTTITCLFPY